MSADSLARLAAELDRPLRSLSAFEQLPAAQLDLLTAAIRDARIRECADLDRTLRRNPLAMLFGWTVPRP
jgi:hypothetical protein